MIESKNDANRNLEKALEQAKQRVANEKKKQNEKKRKIGFIFYMVTTGVEAVRGFITLGTVEQGWVFDERKGIEVMGIFIFTVLPLIYMILVAFTNYDSTHQPPGKLFDWVGFQNFATLLHRDSPLGASFWPILGWTIFWAVIATITCF